MTGPEEPQYPQDPGPYHPPTPPLNYPGQPVHPGQPAYPGYPQEHGAPQRLAERLADRLAARPVPRLGVSLAGVGVGLAILGVLVWGFTYIIEGFGDLSGDGAHAGSRHYLGAVLALIVVAAGYVLAVVAEKGPLATAGIVASAIGVPVTIEFLTFDPGNGDAVNFDALTWGSVAVWLVSYLFVRGSRGHSFYLGLAALVLWNYAVEKAAPTGLSRGLSVFGDQFLGENAPSVSIDTGTVAGVSLTIGALYYVLAWWLDRSGRRGAAVPLVVVGFPAVGVGVAALAPDLKPIGTGIALIVVSVLICAYGARYGRRFTTWIWAVGASVGGALIVVRLVADSGGAPTGIALIVLGAIFVAGGALLARALNEPDDVGVAAPPPAHALPGSG